jgi:hypothetical protein
MKMSRKKTIHFVLLLAFVSLAVLGLQACAPASVSTSPSPMTTHAPPADEAPGT